MFILGVGNDRGNMVGYPRSIMVLGVERSRSQGQYGRLKGQGHRVSTQYGRFSHYCLQHNSKMNDRKVFKLGTGNDFGISFK